MDVVINDDEYVLAFVIFVRLACEYLIFLWTANNLILRGNPFIGFTICLNLMCALIL